MINLKNVPSCAFQEFSELPGLEKGVQKKSYIRWRVPVIVQQSEKVCLFLLKNNRHWDKTKKRKKVQKRREPVAKNEG